MTKKEIKQIERYWKRYGRKNLFTWMHRYFRLHTELLEDETYKKVYNYVRDTLIAYHIKDDKRFDDNYYGVSLDVIADIFNKRAADRVNKYKFAVEDMVFVWKRYPNKTFEIRI